MSCLIVLTLFFGGPALFCSGLWVGWRLAHGYTIVPFSRSDDDEPAYEGDFKQRIHPYSEQAHESIPSSDQ